MGLYAPGVPLGHKWSPTDKAPSSLETPQGANIPYQTTNSPAGGTHACTPKCMFSPKTPMQTGISARRRSPPGSGQSVPFWPACRRLSFNSRS